MFLAFGKNDATNQARDCQEKAMRAQKARARERGSERIGRVLTMLTCMRSAAKVDCVPSVKRPAARAGQLARHRHVSPRTEALDFDEHVRESMRLFPGPAH